MSNKKKIKSKSNNTTGSKITQIANFVVLSEEKDGLKFLTVTTVVGNWKVSFREDNFLHTWITSELKTEDGRNILHLVFATLYAVCNSVPDAQAMEEHIEVYQRSMERMREGITQLSEEADKKITEEEKEKYTTFNPKSDDTKNEIQ